MDKHLIDLIEFYAGYECLECDGLTRILHTILCEQGIEHTTYIGQVHYPLKQQEAPIQFWLDLSPEIRVDYRLQRWFGSSDDIPHGIFNPSSFPSIQYDGDAVELPVLPKSLIKAMLC